MGVEGAGSNSQESAFYVLSELSFEPVDGFLNFKKVDRSKFCQEFNKIIRLVDFKVIIFLGGHIWLNCVGGGG